MAFYISLRLVALARTSSIHCAWINWLVTHAISTKHTPCSYVTKLASILQRVSKGQKVHIYYI